MKSEKEIRETPGLQVVGTFFGAQQIGYLRKCGKRIASVVWSRSQDGWDCVSLRQYGKNKITNDTLEKVKKAFFSAEELERVVTKSYPETDSVYLWLEVKEL